VAKKAKKINYSKGSMSTGVGFGILGMLAIFAMGTMMIGNVTPHRHNDNTQEVIVQHATPEVSKPVLQLQTFPAITLTPTPTPTLPPEPHEKGGTNYGEGPGGHSAPDRGNGGNPGSAI
jgi:hypothetical protein